MSLSTEGFSSSLVRVIPGHADEKKSSEVTQTWFKSELLVTRVSSIIRLTFMHPNNLFYKKEIPYFSVWHTGWVVLFDFATVIDCICS